MAAVTKNGRALEFASDVLKGDREFVLARVKQDGLSLRHASNRGDKEIVVAAVTQDGEALSQRIFLYVHHVLRDLGTLDSFIIHIHYRVAKGLTDSRKKISPNFDPLFL